MTEYEYRISRPEYGIRDILASTAPLRDDEGKVIAAVVVMQDVTRMKESDQRKDEFIATAAHELRNPLTVLLGYNQLLRKFIADVDTPPKVSMYMDAMDRQARRLNGLVERLLDASRIQLGKLVLEKSRVDLRDVAHAVATNVETSDDSGHTIAVKSPAEEVIGTWDPIRVEQVLTNLVSNALRYSPPGTEVEIRVSRQKGEARVEVADRGQGVPPEQRPALFDRYYQGARPVSAGSEQPIKHGGQGSLGLGLHISSEIVEAHGGNIGMEPNPGGGSIFWFTLPI